MRPDLVPLLPVNIKHQIVANTVVVLENGDVVVGQVLAVAARLKEDETGQQVYELDWTMKIGRPA